MSATPLPEKTESPLTPEVESVATPVCLGEGSYHQAYRLGNRVIKEAKLVAHFGPERSVRLCEAVSPDLHPKVDTGESWSMDLFPGKQANDREMVHEVLRIYKSTGRVMLDAMVSGNILSKDGEVRTVDMDCILTRRGSFASDTIIGFSNRLDVYATWLQKYRLFHAKYPYTFEAVSDLYYKTLVKGDLTRDLSPEEIEENLKSYFVEISRTNPVFAFQLALDFKPKTDTNIFCASMMVKCIEHFQKEELWKQVIGLVSDQKMILRECIRQLLCQLPRVLSDKGSYSDAAKDGYRHRLMFLMFESMNISMPFCTITDEGDLTRRLLHFFSTREFQEKGKNNLYRLSMYRVLLAMLGVSSDDFFKVENQDTSSIFVSLCQTILKEDSDKQKRASSEKLPYTLDESHLDALCGFIETRIACASPEDRPALKDKIDQELLSYFFIPEVAAMRLNALFEGPVVSPLSLAFGRDFFARGSLHRAKKDGVSEGDYDDSESLASGSD